LRWFPTSDDDGRRRRSIYTVFFFLGMETFQTRRPAQVNPVVHCPIITRALKLHVPVT